MKTRPITIMTDISVKEKPAIENPFTWAKVHARMIHLKNRLPEPWDELLHTDSVNDTKTSFRLLLAVSVPLLGLGLCATPILIAIYVHSLLKSNKKGGRK